jgi:heme/copper-type cytochrome/quinol oxidase subunit 2
MLFIYYFIFELRCIDVRLLLFDMSNCNFSAAMDEINKLIIIIIINIISHVCIFLCVYVILVYFLFFDCADPVKDSCRC